MTHSESSVSTPALTKRKPVLFVLQSGLITSAISLAGVYFLNKQAEDFNIMGWYANYVIPIGAIIVGLIAGAGYGLASWWTGVKITRGLLVAVIVLQALCYVAAEYVEYRDVRSGIAQSLTESGISDADAAALGITTPSFVEYFQFKAESFAWKPKNGKGEGEPMGKWGYLFVGLGAIGFIAGGLIAPAVLRSKPYCDHCQVYMKTRQLGLMPASIAARKVKKSDVTGLQEYEAEQTSAVEAGADRLTQLTALATAGDAAGFRAYLSAFDTDKKAIGKLPRRIDVSVTRCPGCDAGQLVCSVVSGSGDKVTTEKLPPIALTPEFARAVTA
jgi:hypothetical protein